MRILIMGAGAVGGYFGSRLQLAGEEVTLVARGKNLEIIGRDGLQVKSHRGDVHLRMSATDDPSSLGEFDLIIVTVKSYDTEEAAEIMAANVGPSTLVLSLQNGVENDEVLADRFGWEKILGGVAYIGASLIEPGVIGHHSAGRISIGEYPWGAKGAAALASDIGRGLEITLSPDIQAEKWRKLLFNAAFNTVTALMGVSFREAAECQGTREVALGIVAEGGLVARAEGVALPADVEGDLLGLARALGDAPSSMLTDLRAGKRLELEALLGVIMRKGDPRGISTPVSRTVFSLLSHLNGHPARE